MIPVQHEDVEELRKWGMGLENLVERCWFCADFTRYWHMPTNNPVCPACAKAHTVGELKNRLREA